jgi:hypothetical protein
MSQVPIRIIYMSAQQGDAPVDMKPEHLTPEQQAAMDEVYTQIAAGDLAEQLGAVNAEAFAEG